MRTYHWSVFDKRLSYLTLKAPIITVFRRLKGCLLLLCLLAMVAPSYAQSSKKEKRISSVQKSAGKLSESLEQSAPDETIAAEYVVLARELAGNNEYERAEDYLKRALPLYQKLKNNEQTGLVYRELAKVQEAQGRFLEAEASYRNAARYATDEVLKNLSTNDANRLRKPEDLTSQSVYIQQNIDLATVSNTTTEKIAAHRQMAEVRLAQDDKQGALEELEKALAESEKAWEETAEAEIANTKRAETEKAGKAMAKPGKMQQEKVVLGESKAVSSVASKEVSFRIKQDIAQTLVTDNKMEAAIRLHKELVEEARRDNNTQKEVEQLQLLAASYFEAVQPSEGIDALEEAYHTALGKGLTLETKRIVGQMADYYRKVHDMPKALAVYSDFVNRLDTLVKKDSTLMDDQLFRMQEDKISQLEKERALKDELIDRKNTSNKVLIASIILILLSLAVIIKILLDSIRKNKKIALQSLRREMNPHFIFNSLNSVNQFIAENNELEANKYLSSYSKLMRTIMENSNNDFISLSTELEHLREYLALEQQRFRDKFTYLIRIDESLDIDAVLIPNMLIQPQLENAIWHGLRYKNEAGVLLLTISRENDRICATVEDDGIGLKKSRELKTTHQQARQSRGQTNTQERIDLLNHLYHTKITMEIIDKNEEKSGVCVIFHFPLVDRKNTNRWKK